MKKLIVLAAIFIISNSAFSQTPAKKENVETLLSLMGTVKAAMQVMDQMNATYKKNFPAVPTEFWDDFKKEIKPDMLIDLVTPIYMKHFSDEEVMQLIEFYRSPVGKKLAEKTPIITSESYNAGAELGKQIGEKLLVRLKEKGYFKQ